VRFWGDRWKFPSIKLACSYVNYLWDTILAAKADVNAKQGRNSKDGDTALTLAARKGHLEVVQALLAAKADVNAGWEPVLSYATRVGNLDLVKVLLAAKPDLDWQDPLGRTALLHVRNDRSRKDVIVFRSLLQITALLSSYAAPTLIISTIGPPAAISGERIGFSQVPSRLSRTNCNSR
jgi:ankyrin repeat protein